MTTAALVACAPVPASAPAPIVTARSSVVAEVPPAAPKPTDPTRAWSPRSAGSDCDPGLLRRDGACARCVENSDCPSSACTIETGRCEPAYGCIRRTDCPAETTCDGAWCVFQPPPSTAGRVPCELEAVYFAFDSAVIPPTQHDRLRSAASCIASRGSTVYLEAHADDVGTEEFNILLTSIRGNAVQSVLERFGVPLQQMRVIAKGSLEAAGTDASSRAADRRVQLVWP